MSKTFSISGQHYLFDVQTFAQTALSTGGDEFHYTLFDGKTQDVIDNVVEGTSDLGVLMRTSRTASELDGALSAVGLEFIGLMRSAPRIALPASHPMVNAQKLSLDDMVDYPYIFFDQGENAPLCFYEEALSDVKRDKTIACTDRATLSELIVALNGYTVTSGILVGISDGSLLTTIPLDTDVELEIGYIKRAGSQPNELEAKFIDKLKVNLERYARF